MSPETRLAEIVAALETVGLTCLVMGGHAVRFYGLQRNTIDFDLHLSPDHWDDLPDRLKRTAMFAGQALAEGPSWRPHAFRRFPIGRLPDGREEWLELWRTNRLLPPFAELYPRREAGPYGGRTLPFLSLPDLIRSKETERNGDWQDVSVLEEFLDARLLAQVERGGLPLDVASTRAALAEARLSITQAYLLPSVPDTPALSSLPVPIEPIILNRLRTVTPGSALHLALVEAVRRQYKVAAQAADRADKQATRAAQAPPPAPQGGGS